MIDAHEVRLACPTCHVPVELVVDGQPMLEHQLLALRRVPRSIKRRQTHMLWCDSDDHRMQLMSHIGLPDE